MANVEGMVNEAIRAYKSGKKDEAQALLVKATELDENSEKAWMWLSAVVESIDDQMVCLENVLVINPDNKDARRGLDILKKKAASQPKAPNPFTNVSEEWGDIDADTSGFMGDLDVDTPSYGGKSTATFTEEDDGDEYSSTFDEAFTDAGFDSAYEDLEDLGGALFDESDFDAEIDPPSDLDLTAGPFGESLFDDDDDDDNDFGSLFDDDPEPEPEPVRSSPARKSSPAPEPVGDVFFSTEKSANQDEEDPSAYFAKIPSPIKPTRLPGLGKSSSPLRRILVPILMLANIGAILLLIMNLA